MFSDNFESLSFDPSEFYLGDRLCKVGHKWQGSGKTLRCRKDKKCAECNEIENKKTAIDVDGNTYRLGRLCDKGHDWQDTQKSLRYLLPNRGCVECQKNRGRRAQEKNRQSRCETGTLDYLGRLCGFGHDFNKTGKSLRFVSNRKCKQCALNEINQRRLMNPEKYRQKGKEYRVANIEDCRRRDRENKRQYSLVHRDKINRRQRDRWANLTSEEKEKISQKNREYRVAHADEIKAICRLWRKNNPDRMKVLNQRRRALKRHNHKAPYTAKCISKRIAEFESKCAYCNKAVDLKEKNGCQIDHFIPLSRGGSDVLGNFVPACPSCNYSKRANDPFEWYQKQPFFSMTRWRKILKILGKTSKNHTQIPLI